MCKDDCDSCGRVVGALLALDFVGAYLGVRSLRVWNGGSSKVPEAVEPNSYSQVLQLCSPLRLKCSQLLVTPVVRIVARRLDAGPGCASAIFVIALALHFLWCNLNAQDIVLYSRSMELSLTIQH